jgi:hypothetical protein
MRLDFSNFFIKFVYYTYIAGLILLFLDIPGFIIAGGNFFGVFPSLQIFLPIAGLSGLIPVAFIFFTILMFGSKLHFLGFLIFVLYIVLIFVIFLQKKIIYKIKQAIDNDLKKEPVFKIIILHHFWTNATVALFMAYAIINFPFFSDPFFMWWLFSTLFNFLIALGVWRWTKK